MKLLIDAPLTLAPTHAHAVLQKMKHTHMHTQTHPHTELSGNEGKQDKKRIRASQERKTGHGEGRKEERKGE